MLLYSDQSTSRAAIRPCVGQAHQKPLTLRSSAVRSRKSPLFCQFSVTDFATRPPPSKPRLTVAHPSGTTTGLRAGHCDNITGRVAVQHNSARSHSDSASGVRAFRAPRKTASAHLTLPRVQNLRQHFLLRNSETRFAQVQLFAKHPPGRLTQAPKSGKYANRFPPTSTHLPSCKTTIPVYAMSHVFASPANTGTQISAKSLLTVPLRDLVFSDHTSARL